MVIVYIRLPLLFAARARDIALRSRAKKANAARVAAAAVASRIELRVVGGHSCEERLVIKHRLQPAAFLRLSESPPFSRRCRAPRRGRQSRVCKRRALESGFYAR